MHVRRRFMKMSRKRSKPSSRRQALGGIDVKASHPGGCAAIEDTD